MANKLHIYMNNPTNRMKDGTEASTDTETSPIAVLLDAAKEEEKAVKCAVRCDSGYKAEGAVTIKFVGTNAAKWKAARHLRTWLRLTGKIHSPCKASARVMSSSGSRR